MVFKVSKGGVRTGNTLRGLNSTRTKRYGRHACLVGCTSLGRRDLSRLLTSQSEHSELVKETLSKTNVLLSLNKQQRWRLPAIIGHMIKQGDFNKGATVSMLEKHKLKRKANCVSLVSNSQRNRVTSPGQKKYFSFSLDALAGDESHRKKRRARALELKKAKAQKEKVVKIKNTFYKAVETYTTQGLETTEEVDIVSDKPEYRLEVLYPCPQSCSLTYNPKYTDVVVAEGKTGELEVKSNVKAPKKGHGTHRKRLTGRDIDRLNMDLNYEPSGEMNSEIYDGFEESGSEADTERYTDRSSESIISLLLAQAEKTRSLCVQKKVSTPRKSNKKCKSKRNGEEIDDKSHIIFIDREKEESKPSQAIYNTDTVIEEKTSNLHFLRVILNTSEICPEKMREQYGPLYAESSTQPRRFVLDITDDISSLLALSKASCNNSSYSSFLVFVYDGFYDNELEAFRVTLNSAVLNDTQLLSKTVPFTKTSIPDIMNAVVGYLLDLKEQNALDISDTKSTATQKNETNFLASRIQLKVDIVCPSENVLRDSIQDEVGTWIHRDSGSPMMEMMALGLEDNEFCDVCYVSVNPSTLDSVPGIRLQPCRHVLCDQCWAAHFRTLMKAGKTTMTCAGYDCNTSVGNATLLSVLGVSEVARLVQRQKEEEVETQDNIKWCPYPECGRFIRVDSKWNDLCVDVICDCGNKLCFSCFGPAHWPARCDQAEEYLEKLPTLTPMKEGLEEEEKRIPRPILPLKKKESTTMMVEGRLCPKCNRFIEKNGGCPHMVCKCGLALCWTCMKPYNTHSSLGFCIPDQAHVYKYTRVIIVRHTAARNPVPLSPPAQYEPPKVERNKQKASLYQRALRQRSESSPSYYQPHIKVLAGKMGLASSTDVDFKEEILKALSDTSLPASVSTVTLTSKLKSFLHSSVRIKQELHHVTEYSFILLQGTAHSVTKQRVLKLTDDLNGYCCFLRSILDLKDNQDVKVAFRRILQLQEWATRALSALVVVTRGLRAGQS